MIASVALVVLFVTTPGLGKGFAKPREVTWMKQSFVLWQKNHRNDDISSNLMLGCSANEYCQLFNVMKSAWSRIWFGGSVSILFCIFSEAALQNSE